MQKLTKAALAALVMMTAFAAGGCSGTPDTATPVTGGVPLKR
jgi:hypothetical protein